MKIKFLFLILFCCLTFGLNAQMKKQHAPKYSIGKGTIFFYLGYNRSAYSKSNIHFTGDGYDFTLKDVQAKNIPTKDIKDFFNPITYPQFNFRLGYFFRDNWSINIGVDHMKYALVDSSKALMSGTVGQGKDDVWNGNYSNQSVLISKNHFYYGNIAGQYYAHAEAMYSVYLYRSDQGKFAIPVNGGLGLGAVISSNDFTFGGNTSTRTVSLSGLGVSAQLGLRMEFFSVLFLQLEGSGGFMQQFKVANRPNEPAFAKQNYFYGMYQVDLGFNIYIRSKNACDSCPKW